MNFKYYPLDKAAEILNCSVDDLIHYGAEGEIPIHVLCGAWSVYSMNRKHGMPIWDNWCSASTATMQLHERCLFEYFSGNKSAEIMLKPMSSMGNHDFDEIIFILRRKDFLYPSNEELLYWIRQGKDPSGMIPEPIKLSECKMVVLYGDLEQFKKTLSQGKRKKIEQTDDHESIDLKAWEVEDPRDKSPDMKFKYRWWIAARYFARLLVTEDEKLLSNKKLLRKKVANNLCAKGIKFANGTDDKPMSEQSLKAPLAKIDDWSLKLD